MRKSIDFTTAKISRHAGTKTAISFKPDDFRFRHGCRGLCLHRDWAKNVKVKMSVFAYLNVVFPRAFRSARAESAP